MRPILVTGWGKMLPGHTLNKSFPFSFHDQNAHTHREEEEREERPTPSFQL
ncbi:hypothetical protein RHMOL_Rhmol08G0149800 [Rhododendron molle]|uniref:Uncharacterized protein n=2 Tax=Rhododendron molle TaxID=49168 RepID=A0ACC0LRC5_RHOML|nr:hypothetical protein RHMOL_Rhmol11G0095100 [Rhododendron molle]KAI8542594.1 hypothetical protein RHMOL_Rhmol08G0149800 [Rhododendron molle]